MAAVRGLYESHCKELESGKVVAKYAFAVHFGYMSPATCVPYERSLPSFISVIPTLRFQRRRQVKEEGEPETKVESGLFRVTDTLAEDQEQQHERWKVYCNANRNQPK